jgi:hypothetical protein
MRIFALLLLLHCQAFASGTAEPFERGIKNWLNQEMNSGVALHSKKLLPLYRSRPTAMPQAIETEWIVEDKRRDTNYFAAKGIKVLYASSALPGFFLIEGKNPCAKLDVASCRKNYLVRPTLFDLGCENDLAQVDRSIQSFAESLHSELREAQCRISGAADIPSRGIYKGGNTTPSRGEKTRYKKYGFLPRDWAQQLVGTDLLRVFLGNEASTLNPPRIGVNDSGFIPACLAGQTPTATLGIEAEETSCKELDAGDHHGVHVHNIIFQPRYGTEITGRAESVIFDHSGTSPGARPNSIDETKIHRMADFMSAQNVRIVNFSGGRIGGNENAEIAVWRELQKRGMIFVQSSGNFGSHNPVDSMNQQAGGILVGSMDPDGENSSFCQCDGATISAPSNDAIQAFLPDGDSHRFGGTSGSAPMVSGIISNLLAVAPKLKDQHIRELLKRSALRFPNQNPPMANGFRSFLAAKEIQKRCSEAADFDSCATNALKDPRSYDFANLAALYAARAEEQLAKNSCEGKQIAAYLLRAAYLLQPNRRTATELANLYDELEAPSLARFFRRAEGLPFSEPPLR